MDEITTVETVWVPILPEEVENAAKAGEVIAAQPLTTHRHTVTYRRKEIREWVDGPIPTTKLTYDINNDFERTDKAIKCHCGGYAQKVKPTPEEIQQYDCPRKTGCCVRAFTCVLCGMRHVGKAPAPEME